MWILKFGKESREANCHYEPISFYLTIKIPFDGRVSLSFQNTTDASTAHVSIKIELHCLTYHFVHAWHVQIIVKNNIHRKYFSSISSESESNSACVHFIIDLQVKSSSGGDCGYGITWNIGKLIRDIGGAIEVVDLNCIESSIIVVDVHESAMRIGPKI